MPPPASLLATPLANHRTAVQEYIGMAGRLSADVWVRPVAAGKWSPAQITEHVAITIEIFSAELGGRAGLTPRLTPWKRLLLRSFVLPRVLGSGRFPPAARAPRELAPSSQPVQQRDAIDRLRRALTNFDATAAADPAAASRRLTHPYFGRLPAPTAIQLLEIHVRHHLTQLPRRTGPN